LASAGGHLECVKFLVSIGVNINPRDRWGATPLNDATKPEVRKFLVKHGAELGNSVTYHEV
jgi:ankyrin repeat protein